MKKQKFCIECGLPREDGRRRCRACFLIFRRQYMKERTQKYGRFVRPQICLLCNTEFKAWRRDSKFCSVCYRRSHKTASLAEGGYKQMFFNGRIVTEQRKIAEQLLDCRLEANKVVHHIDCTFKNNKLTNLLVMLRRDHTSLHQYLREQKALAAKAKINWKKSIKALTMEWIEAKGAVVIKLWEVKKLAASKI